MAECRIVPMHHPRFNGRRRVGGAIKSPIHFQTYDGCVALGGEGGDAFFMSECRIIPHAIHTSFMRFYPGVPMHMQKASNCK